MIFSSKETSLQKEYTKLFYINHATEKKKKKRLPSKKKKQSNICSCGARKWKLRLPSKPGSESKATWLITFSPQARALTFV